MTPVLILRVLEMTRPADACPYPRPFPADFDACPTFEVEPWAPVDSHFQPLRTQRTCRHLTVGQGNGSYYPRCALGAAIDRARVAAGPVEAAAPV